MIDTDAGKSSTFEPREDERVRYRKYVVVLDPHADELRDVEEAPVVDPVQTGAPVRQLVVLCRHDRAQISRSC